jgi:hypothetical protein
MSQTVRNARGHITLRSPASGLLEGERSSPSVLHFKGFNDDGYLKRRARQVQQLVMRLVC